MSYKHLSFSPQRKNPKNKKPNQTKQTKQQQKTLHLMSLKYGLFLKTRTNISALVKFCWCFRGLFATVKAKCLLFPKWNRHYRKYCGTRKSFDYCADATYSPGHEMHVTFTYLCSLIAGLQEINYHCSTAWFMQGKIPLSLVARAEGKNYL